MEEFIKGIPKCELHMHLFGNSEPEIIFKIAKRNHVEFPYSSPEELRKAYDFNNLDEFIKLFKLGVTVIEHGIDLYDITIDYLQRCSQENTKYAEIMFNVRPLIAKGMKTAEIMENVLRAMKEGQEKYGVTSKLIYVHDRIFDEKIASDIFEEMKPYLEHFVASGIVGSERNFPPRLFVNFFNDIQEIGQKITIHAGEEGPSSYITEAIDLCHADRIDHGVAADDEMVQRLAKEKIPLTMCPISNLKLKVVKDLADHPLKRFLDSGVIVTVNSDDPAFFGGYLNANYIAIQKALNLSQDDIVQLAKNSYIASYLPESEKLKGIQEIDSYVQNYGKTQ